MTKNYTTNVKNPKIIQVHKNQPRLNVINFILNYSASIETLNSQKLTILVQKN